MVSKVGLIDENQAWWWTEEWQKGEREAEKDIKEGKVKKFSNVEDLIKDLVVMMLLKYPIGMQRLPLWEKFGFNEPIGVDKLRKMFKYYDKQGMSPRMASERAEQNISEGPDFFNQLRTSEKTRE